jgi:Flp pilus assembly protein TadB
VADLTWTCGPAASLAGFLAALTVLSGLAGDDLRLRGIAPRRPPAGSASGGATGRAVTPARRATWAGVVAGTAVGVVVGGTAGVVAGPVAGVVLARWLYRVEGRAAADRRAAARRSLPLAVDLLAACLASGSPQARAVRAVSAAVGPPLSDVLAPVAAHLAMGTDPSTAWASAAATADLGAVVAPLARVLGRAGTGARSAATLRRLSRELREELAADASVRAQAVGVRVAGPLGLCFLPAFVLLGVVPTAVGLLAATWGPA